MRQTARTAGSVAVLALLVGACVFAALAGPAVSLRTRTQALSQTLAAASTKKKKKIKKKKKGKKIMCN